MQRRRTRRSISRPPRIPDKSWDRGGGAPKIIRVEEGVIDDGARDRERRTPVTRKHGLTLFPTNVRVGPRRNPRRGAAIVYANSRRGPVVSATQAQPLSTGTGGRGYLRSYPRAGANCGSESLKRLRDGSASCLGLLGALVLKGYIIKSSDAFHNSSLNVPVRKQNVQRIGECVCVCVARPHMHKYLWSYTGHHRLFHFFLFRMSSFEPLDMSRRIRCIRDNRKITK